MQWQEYLSKAQDALYANLESLGEYSRLHPGAATAAALGLVSVGAVIPLVWYHSRLKGLDRTERKLRELTDEYHALEEREREQKKGYAALEEQYTKEKANALAIGIERDRFKRAGELLEKDKAALHRKYTTLQEEVREEQERVAQMRRECGDLQHRVGELGKTMQQRDGEYTALAKEHSDLKLQQGRVGGEYQALTVEHERLKTQYAGMEQEIEQLRTDMDRERAERAEERAHTEGVISRLMEDRRNAERGKEQLAQVVSDAFRISQQTGTYPIMRLQNPPADAPTDDYTVPGKFRHDPRSREQIEEEGRQARARLAAGKPKKIEPGSE